MGGRDNRFRTTLWTQIERCRDPADPAYAENLSRLCAAYWRPIYAYFRRLHGMGVEDAKDLTQSFFVHLMNGRLLGRVDRSRGRFRAYLKTALRHFAADARDAALTLKRGGGTLPFSLDFPDAEQALRPADRRGSTAQEALDAEWSRTIVAAALSRLRKELEQAGRARSYDMFRDYYYPAEASAEKLSYALLARRHGTTPYQAAHDLRRARLLFRDVVMALIHETVSNPKAAEEEYRELFGPSR
jgi:RNA polymerase sigma-70 factor (ECF subfamily)